MCIRDRNKKEYDESKLDLTKAKLEPSCTQVGTKLEEEKTLQPLNGKALLESGLALSESTIAAKKRGPSHRKQDTTVML